MAKVRTIVDLLRMEMVQYLRAIKMRASLHSRGLITVDACNLELGLIELIELMRLMGLIELIFL